jgi:hypothetical protein
MELSDTAALCMRCMKGHITDHQNLSQLKLDIRGCKAVTSGHPNEMFHECVKAKIKNYVSEPCRKTCIVPERLYSSAAFPLPVFPRSTMWFNSFLWPYIVRMWFLYSTVITLRNISYLAWIWNIYLAASCSAITSLILSTSEAKTELFSNNLENDCLRSLELSNLSRSRW